jgi:hypothetical protein
MSRRRVGRSRWRKSILFKAGSIPTTLEDLFERVFWRNSLLAHEAMVFWSHLKEDPGGFSSRDWKRWVGERGITVGQYYNIMRGLRGAGMIEKRGGRYHVSPRFLAELEQMVRVYSAASGYEPRI